MRLLEIGGGAGAVTELLVEALGVDKSEPRCGHLDYTDASPDKVAKAKTKFVEANCMGFKVLEIGKDPQAQGFDCGTYDMVVASMVRSLVSWLGLLAYISNRSPVALALSKLYCRMHASSSSRKLWVASKTNLFP
jgi:hypothetical protein